MKQKNYLLGIGIKAIIDECYRRNIPLEIFSSPHAGRQVPHQFTEQQLCLRVHQGSVPSYSCENEQIKLMMTFGGQPFTIVLPYECFNSIKVPDWDFSLALNSPVDALHEFIEGVVRGALQDKHSHKNIHFELVKPGSENEGVDNQSESKEELPVVHNYEDSNVASEDNQPKRRRPLKTHKKSEEVSFDIIPPKK